ncbi:MAG: thiamine pyrophosphate-dependent enzyme, partial [Planctomycetaceae bacterium]
AHVDDSLVVAAYQAAFEWIVIRPSDFNLIATGAMGQVSSHCLGLALGRPDRRVIGFDGDGSLLMNLGSLVTITQQAPKNLTLIIFDNGIYEITGGQPTPAIDDDGSRVDYPGLARAAGFQQVHAFEDLADWQAAARDLIDADGPTFIHLSISPVPGAIGPRSPSKAPPRAHTFAKTFRAD